LTTEKKRRKKAINDHPLGNPRGLTVKGQDVKVHHQKWLAVATSVLTRERRGEGGKEV